MGDYSVGNHSYGFLKDGSTFTQINIPGSIFTEALAINDQGQIVGDYFDDSGFHSYVATISDLDALSAPEPSTLWISVLGGTLWLGYAWCRRRATA